MNLFNERQEENMRALDVFRGVTKAIGDSIANGLSGSTFNCGDCERSHRCGLPPSEKCIVRAAQMERDPNGYKRRRIARALMLGLGRWH